MSQRRRTPPEGRAHLAVGRTCRARGAHAAAAAAAATLPTPTPGAQKPPGGKRERRALHSSTARPTRDGERG